MYISNKWIAVRKLNLKIIIIIKIITSARKVGYFVFLFYVAVVYSRLFFHVYICKTQTCGTVPCGEQSAEPRLFCLSNRFPYTSLQVCFFIYLGSVPSKGCMTADLCTWQSDTLSTMRKTQGQVPLESKSLVLQRRSLFAGSLIFHSSSM